MLKSDRSMCDMHAADWKMSSIYPLPSHPPKNLPELLVRQLSNLNALYIYMTVKLYNFKTKKANPRDLSILEYEDFVECFEGPSVRGFNGHPGSCDALKQ